MMQSEDGPLVAQQEQSGACGGRGRGAPTFRNRWCKGPTPFSEGSTPLMNPPHNRYFF